MLRFKKTIKHLRDQLEMRVGFGNVARLKGYQKKFRICLALQQKSLASVANKKKIILLGVAHNGNVGDLAIGMAQRQALSKYLDYEVVEILAGELPAYVRWLQAYVTPEDIICFQGGGNMGGEYPQHEFSRLAMLQLFPNHTFVLMPQTISYRDTPAERRLLAYTQKVYAAHQRLCLLAREKVSYQAMRQYYPHNRVLLTPDIVMAMDVAPYLDESARREGALLCLRNDVEKMLDDTVPQKVESCLRSLGLPYSYTDTYEEVAHKIGAVEREQRVREKLRQFQRAQVIITDRLHGMVLAALTQTPCVVLGNYNHKVEGAYQWYRELPYVQFAQNASEIPALVEQVLQVPDCKYPREKFLRHFDVLDSLFGRGSANE